MTRAQAVAGLALTILAGCADPSQPEPEAVASVSVTAPGSTVPSSGTLALAVTVTGSRGSALRDRTVTWSSSDTAIAKVSATGIVTAGRVLGATAAPVTITATSEGRVGSISLSVLPVEIATVTVTPPVATLASSDTLRLIAEVRGAGGELLDRKVVWSSAQSSVAAVDSSGRVTSARVLDANPRPVEITATAGSVSAIARLSVLPVPAASVTLDVGDVALAAGDTRPVSATVRDATGAILPARPVSWSSSAPGVAQVVGGSRIETLAAGNATLTARADSATVTVTVAVVATDTYSMPTDPDLISYPWSYRTPNVSSAAQNDPCDLTSSHLTVPRSWMGTSELPATTGVPLASTIQRGIGHKDVWQAGNPSFAEGCNGDVRQAFLRTLDRLKAIGADYITLTPWTFLNISKGVWSILDPDDVGSSILGDADLAWAVQQAKARGLRVHWMNQIQGGFEDGNPVTPAGTVENVNKFFDVYEPYMLARAALLSSIGVDVMQVSCVCWTYLEAPQLAEVYGARMAEIVPKIRAAFNGGLRMKAHPSLTTRAPLRNAVDYVELTYWFGHLGLTDPNPSMSTLTSRYRTALQGETGIYGGVGKPVIFELYAASRADFLTTGYIEETFCVSEFGTIWGSDTACIQRAMRPDFALQARLLQAQLAVAAEQTALPVYGVETGAYWMVDQLSPSTTFPNIAVSPRNKPAEGVLKAWFQR